MPKRSGGLARTTGGNSLANAFWKTELHKYSNSKYSTPNLYREYQNIVKTEEKASKFGNLILEEDPEKWDDLKINNTDEDYEEYEELDEEEQGGDESNLAAADCNSEYDEVEL